MTAPNGRLTLRLYVAGRAPNSLQAIENLKAVCDAHFPDQHDIEIVDVLRDPQRALIDTIIVTPTLLKLYPAPAERIVGSLSEAAPLLLALGAP